MKRRILVLGLVCAALAHGCTITQTGLSVDDGAGTGGDGPGVGGTGGAPIAGNGVGGSAGTDGGITQTGGGTPLGGSGGSRDAAVAPDAPTLPCTGATGTGKAPGATCACNGECAGNFCVDGVCCEEACAGPCRTCAAAASKGRCVFSPAGQKDGRNQCAVQAANTCGTSGLCDGQGGCSKHLEGTGCGAAADCQGAIFTGAATCDGKGVCTPGPKVPCNPYTCGVGACLSSCAATKDCAAGLMCNNNGRCEGPRSLGATCTSSSQCGSGFCVDNVCCNEACVGQCRSCALPASRGQCQLVPSGDMAMRGECPMQAASTCGRNGACDGQGACKLYPVDTQCVAASCMSGTQRSVSLCNGAGTCAAGTSRPCSPYACGGAAMCLASCSGDSGCVDGNICVLGACGIHPILDIPFTAVAPVIDGAIDPVWSTATPAQNIAKVLVGQAANNSSMTFRALWSQAGFHLLLLIQDTQRFNDSAGQGSFDDDTVEVYIDADGNRGTSLDGVNDHHFLFGWNDTVAQNVSLRRTDGVGFAQVDGAPGYLIELTFPWATLGGGAASAGKIIGLDVHVNDDDDGGLRDRKLAWFATQDVSFRDPSSYMRIRLSP